MDEVIRVITFLVEKFYNLKTHLRGRKYIIKQKKTAFYVPNNANKKKTAFLCAQKTSKKKKAHKQNKKKKNLYTLKCV